MKAVSRSSRYSTLFSTMTTSFIDVLSTEVVVLVLAHGGERLGCTEILGRVGDYGVDRVCVTGGEPLAQKRCKKFLERLCDEGYAVSLETSGAMDIARADRRVSRVMDIKTPASREESSNRWENLAELTPNDQVKFVICSRSDYEWAREQVFLHDLPGYCAVLFSPAWGLLDPAELAGWILEDRLPVRFQLQLHKLLWGDEPGR